MLWDCESCGTKKLLGVAHRHCPNCGAVQDEERRYFPAMDEAVGTADDIEVLAALDAMAAPGNEITLLHFDSSGVPATVDLWECFAGRTGGSACGRMNVF